MGMMVVIGIVYSKKNSNVSDFYLGGRKLGPLVSAMSAEASDMSSYLLMGLPGLAYLCGTAEVSWTVIGLAVGTYLNWLIVAKRLRVYSQKCGAITIPDFFSLRYRDDKNIIMGVSALIILIFFTRLVYMPLRKITKGAENYADGNYHYEVSVDSRDEMGYLAAALNYMAGKIADAEDDQKKFIANVSHDFRSPLTSIKGYLEAMLDGTIPPEMHEKYLGIVLNETERLTKLTNGLLSLNNLNTKGMHLDITDFDINDTVRKVAETFEGTCRKKSIAIELVLMGDELFVHADKGRIEQIIYNLTDNAVKFSNNDSVIRIETAEKKNKIYVSVKDNGIGIPPEDVGMIFNRFYKSDASRGKDKKGTGLGLSIVKEILAAHDENINVISTPGEGSEFIFSLQPSDPDEI